MSKYQNKHIQSMFNISSATVRKWADEFSDFLSPSANPPSGTTRRFTDQDVQVFATIIRLKHMSMTTDEVIAELETGTLDEMPVQVPNELVEVASNSTGALILKAIEQFEQRLDKLENGLDKKDSEIARLNQEIGRLTALLEIERSKGQGD